MIQPTQTLHEAVSKKFDKTQNGAIFTKDLKIIFSLLIICLELTEKPVSNGPKVSFWSRQYPYSFSLSDAVQAMGSLSSTIESSATKTTISYAIKPELARCLIKKFMNAKLIHTPADRTRAEPKEKVLLQPTPKGVAVLQSYCKMFGYKPHNSMPILLSTFNSMNLFSFERSAITDTIVYSEYFIHLLFSRFVGPQPNVWSPSNPPDEIPSLDQKIDVVDEFEFSNFQNESFQFSSFEQYQQGHQSNTNQTQQQTENNPKKMIFNLVPGIKKTVKPRESPFHHNFFTNPESDSHIQYYVSSKGVRLDHNREFGKMLRVEYCFNAKAAWQWLMDCTDIMYPQEAVMVLNLFYKYGLIEPIIVPPSTASSKKNFAPLKTSFYTLSKRGMEISSWTGKKRAISRADDEEIIRDASALALNDSTESESISDDDLPNVNKTSLSIKEVLADPGMRYLFRTHLEKEYCAENLDVYIDIKQFAKKMAILNSLLEAYKKQKVVKISSKTTIKPPSKRTLVKLVNECLSAVYNIYSSYIAVGAPYEVNIDHLLRGKITGNILHSSSPLKTQSAENSRLITTVTEEESDDIDELKMPEPVHINQDKSSSRAQSPIEANDIDGLNSPIQTRRRINAKNLSIDIVKNELANDPQRTPTEEEMTRSLSLLYELNPLIDAVGEQILKMLEFDSFPKFIKSEAFTDANI